MKHLCLPVLALALLVGCATAPKTSMVIAEPNQYSIQNELYVDSSFDEVWDLLVAELSQSFFVINNIAKESRLINLSFSTNSPEKYIDCGSTRRTYKKEVYEYDIAENSVYKYATQNSTNQFTQYEVMRKTSLEGRFNVYVAPEGSGTKLSVNVRFVFEVEVSGVYEVIGGALKIRQASGVMQTSHGSVTFDTSQPGRENWGTPSEPGYVTCSSNGRLEALILDMVRQQ